MTWREPRKTKLKLFKQIKGQGLIDWIMGRVPGDYEKEGGHRAFKRETQKQIVSQALTSSIYSL